MKTDKKIRNYNNKKRAAGAAETSDRIIRTVGELWKENPVHEITLEQVADKSGVTIRTILRKFGSRDGLIQACLDYDVHFIIEERRKAPIGNIDGIIRALLTNYEEMGDAGIRTIYMENEFKEARDIGEKGRKEHRKWCAEVFAPFLPDPGDEDYELRLAAFITSTEIYLWKLLRKDLAYDQEQTFSVFKMLVEGLVLKFNKQ